MTRLKDKGLQPKKQMLDNQALRAFLDVIEENGLEWELVPPHNHRRNVAERAIQTAKGHIIANVLGCDPTFPLKEWHRIIPQMELTLNMLGPSNVRHTVSAHTYVYGQHDYNRMPLAPLGCATQCFAANTQRLTFGAHSMDSWYIGTSNEHYRCQKVFLKETRAEQITDTIIFHHKRITCPTVSAADAIVAAANKLNQTIQNNMKESLTNVDMNELDRLENIFQEAAQKISEADARQLRVPRRNDTTPRVSTNNAEEQNRSDIAPRVETLQEDGPRYMTRSQKRIRGSIATDVMLTVIQLTSPVLNPKRLASRKYPLEMLCEFANAVMDDETGDMLEYRQLIKRPKY
jgi:hypothetical protein